MTGNQSKIIEPEYENGGEEKGGVDGLFPPVYQFSVEEKPEERMQDNYGVALETDFLLLKSGSQASYGMFQTANMDAPAGISSPFSPMNWPDLMCGKNEPEGPEGVTARERVIAENWRRINEVTNYIEEEVPSGSQVMDQREGIKGATTYSKEMILDEIKKGTDTGNYFLDVFSRKMIRKDN